MDLLVNWQKAIGRIKAPNLAMWQNLPTGWISATPKSPEKSPDLQEMLGSGMATPSASENEEPTESFRRPLEVASLCYINCEPFKKHQAHLTQKMSGFIQPLIYSFSPWKEAGFFVTTKLVRLPSASLSLVFLGGRCQTNFRDTVDGAKSHPRLGV